LRVITQSLNQEDHMKKGAVLFVGIMLASATVGMANDRWAEDRLKAKTGRYSATEEARRKVSQSEKKPAAGCMQHPCCSREHKSAHEAK
jgi:hypothetical protein